MAITDINKSPFSPQSLRRFWALVDKSDLGGCWLFTGHLDRNGYGRYGGGPRRTHTHRLTYRLCVGPIPHGLFVCHRCDVPACCNPQHLFIGTQKDNIQDAVHKGRMASGSRHGSRTHPERVARGDRAGLRVHPESAARGERNGHATHPECTPKGVSHGRAKLTEADVLRIRALRADKSVMVNTLCRQYGVSRSTILRIVSRNNWTHI